MNRGSRFRAVGVAAVMVGLAACGSPGTESPPDSPPRIVELGMNDVTMLLPLPANRDQPVLLGLAGDGPGRELVPPAVFDEVCRTNRFPLDDTQFQVVAVRFDLCDRDGGDPCPVTDGQLRLVLQGIDLDPAQRTGTLERAVHALYRIPASDLPDAVAQLRALATLARIPTTSPLVVNTAVTDIPEYRDRLRAFVTTYARGDRLSRLAMFGGFSGIGETWLFVGDDFRITGLSPLPPDSLFTRGSLPPFDDQPPGLRLAFNPLAFDAATPEERTPALKVLAAIENPRMIGAANVRCLACHMSTAFETRNLTVAGVDPSTVPGRFSTTYNVSIAAGAASQAVFSFRSLGYLQSNPSISQRAANETANVLAEIAVRFPPTR